MNADLPVLDDSPAMDAPYGAFLLALKNAGFRGDICSDYASRLSVATDNSVYQVLPQCLLCPRDEADTQRILQLAARSEFHALQFSPRGGGTGTNGQSLNTGIVIDVSRYQNAILELNETEGWVRVQPGVILDQLQDLLIPKAYFFAPELSPSNRATLGGMANTDACGKGSRLYGRTGDHVLALRVVLNDGSVIASQRLSVRALQEKQQQMDREGELYRNSASACQQVPPIANADKLGRFVTAYNLWHAFDESGGFSLNPLLCGSEGTLAVVTELTLKITPLPKQKALFAIRYKTFDDALAAARDLLKYQPSAVETVDDKILTLAKNDIIFPKVRPFLGEGDDFSGNAVNLVEFVADARSEFELKVQALRAELPNARGVLSFHYSEDKTEQNVLWDLRKKGVGLLGNTAGKRRPIPFVEDTAVPPEHLADYIREFRVLLDSHGLTYGMFGHVDVGCLHVRPALNLRDNADEALFHTISDAVYELVKKYGGVMWSEHGKGYRSAYGPEFHGAEVYTRMRQVKTAFDPRNQFNPGKICAPLDSAAPLVDPFAQTRAGFDKHIDVVAEEQTPGALYCNGNGQCFDYRMDSVMCPSYKASGDRVHSPKGRSGLMREWLRQLSEKSYPLARTAHAPMTFAQKWQREWRRLSPANRDFSHEVKAAMDGCLSCKACVMQCPIKVDVPTQKTEFLFHYHRRYPRPLRDYLMGSMERWAPMAARFPGLANLLLLNPLSKLLASRFLQLEALPYFSEIPLDSVLRRHAHWRYDKLLLLQLSATEKSKTVLLVQDPFTSFFDVPTLRDCALLLEKLGLRVMVLPYIETGKALQVKGRLRRFERVARAALQRLRDCAVEGVAMVGVEPANTLLWRQEYASFGRDGPKVQLLQEFLATQPLAGSEKRSGVSAYLFGHCTEKTQVAAAPELWRKVFDACGVQLHTVNTGCCGMAGNFGHESENQQVSATLYAQSWKEPLQQMDAQAKACASGYSCRCQSKRFGAQQLPHPATVLLNALEEKSLTGVSP